jgi:hypothetical protein
MESNLAYATGSVAAQNEAVAQREPEVLGELTRLMNCCESLDKLTAELEERLKGVLSPKDDSQKNPGVAVMVRVPLAQAFHDRVVSLDSIAGRLSSVINRLEI